METCPQEDKICGYELNVVFYDNIIISPCWAEQYMLYCVSSQFFSNIISTFKTISEAHFDAAIKLTMMSAFCGIQFYAN